MCVHYCILNIVTPCSPKQRRATGQPSADPSTTQPMLMCVHYYIAERRHPFKRYLFGRHDSGATPNCSSGMISINVRASVDQGRTWTNPHPVAVPDAAEGTCIYADGAAFYDSQEGRWHYLCQVLFTNATAGWQLSHFSSSAANPLEEAWVPNPHNPVVTSGALWSKICSGSRKHCQVGMVDEGTSNVCEIIIIDDASTLLFSLTREGGGGSARPISVVSVRRQAAPSMLTCSCAFRRPNVMTHRNDSS